MLHVYGYQASQLHEFGINNNWSVNSTAIIELTSSPEWFGNFACPLHMLSLVTVLEARKEGDKENGKGEGNRARGSWGGGQGEEGGGEEN